MGRVISALAGLPGGLFEEDSPGGDPLDRLWSGIDGDGLHIVCQLEDNGLS